MLQSMARYGGALLKRIGSTIRKRRQALRMSQFTMADKARLSPTYVSQIEAGKRNPTAITLDRIATALQTKMFDLFKE